MRGLFDSNSKNNLIFECPMIEMKQVHRWIAKNLLVLCHFGEKNSNPSLKIIDKPLFFEMI